MPPRTALARRTIHGQHPAPSTDPAQLWEDPEALRPVRVPPVLPGWLQLFETPRGAAEVITALLKSSPGPATGILEWAAKVRLHADVTRVWRPLTEDERGRLEATKMTAGHERRGQLLTEAGVPAADVRLLLLMNRIPERARTLLTGTSTPAGTVLDAYGMRRTRQTAMNLYGYAGRPAIMSYAVLCLEGRTEPFGLVWEEVTQKFCKLAARRARPEYV